MILGLRRRVKTIAWVLPEKGESGIAEETQDCDSNDMAKALDSVCSSSISSLLHGSIRFFNLNPRKQRKTKEQLGFFK